jgi:hypothetical protein
MPLDASASQNSANHGGMQQAHAGTPAAWLGTAFTYDALNRLAAVAAAGGTANDLSRLTDAREKGRIGIFGSALSYAGAYGRVTSESLGRDLNPLGRGNGGSYVAGGLNLGRSNPRLPMNTSPGGWGNSVNNGCGSDRKSSTLVTQVVNATVTDEDLPHKSFRNAGQDEFWTNPNGNYCYTEPAFKELMCKWQKYRIG